nr:E4 ubiquitin-protein ligase UFD2-like [Procambarus clarkii]XP_045591252.1 E4 ubiquitin-protein ligase UFD2-like [Procambarus clarkii]
MFCDHEACPNPHLRVELLHLIGMWPETYLQDAASGMQAAAGLVNTSHYITLDHLMSGYLHASLFDPLKNVLDSLNKWGHLDGVAAAAVDQVRKLKIGTEAYFFNNLVHLFKQMVEATLAEYRAGINKMCSCIEGNLCTFNEILHIYKMLVDTTPTAYGVPGLAQVAAEFLVTLTDSAVTVCSALQLKDSKRSKYSKELVADLGDIYQKISVEERFTSVFQILKRDHAQQFSHLSKQTTDFCFFHYLSESRQESSEAVPEEFVDSVTQVVMEAPVLLLSSKMVIDESTLVRLLLESASDPFTRHPLVHGSFSRLPHLQADILAWKNTRSALPQ